MMSNPLAGHGRYGPYIPPDLPTWCASCEVHRATSREPLCPSCVEDDLSESSSETVLE
jgi:hypothetical protein